MLRLDKMGAGSGKTGAGIVARVAVPVCSGVLRGSGVVLWCAALAFAPEAAAARGRAMPAVDEQATPAVGEVVARGTSQNMR